MSKDNKVITMPVKPWMETFEDTYNSTIRLYSSSAASEDCIWLGCKDTDGKYAPMHLNVSQAKILINKLQLWVNEIEGNESLLTRKLKGKSQSQLIDIITKYDEYIYDITEDGEGCPVSLAEFIDNDYEIDDYSPVDAMLAEHIQALTYVVNVYRNYIADCKDNDSEPLKLVQFLEEQFPVYSHISEEEYDD